MLSAAVPRAWNRGCILSARIVVQSNGPMYIPWSRGESGLGISMEARRPHTSVQPSPRIAVPIVLLAALVGGCGETSFFSSSTWDPFGLMYPGGMHAEPVRIGLCCDYRGVFDIRNWGRRAPWDDLTRELSAYLGRPVAVEALEPFQAGFHLRETGRLDFALMNATDYLEANQKGSIGSVLAMSEPRTRQGVVVARATSAIQEMSDLKGQFFAFGPQDDPVLFHATVAALKASGVALSDIRTLFPGQQQCHIASRECAKEIIYGLGTEAGVIEAEEFDAYPATGGRWIPLAETFSKDQFRVLGRTEPVEVISLGAGPWVAGGHADPKVVERVREFLLQADRAHPDVLRSLGFARFRAAPGDPSREIRRLAAAQAPAP